MIKLVSLICSLTIITSLAGQQKVIPLYEGVAPGSESWDWEEKTFFAAAPMNANIVYNISKPTLTVFTPDTPNGASVLICPGGGFRVLNMEREGTNVAKELSQKGYTVFVLKYRLLKSNTEDPWLEMITAMKDSLKFRADNAAFRNYAIADATEAMKYIRAHASEFRIDPKRVGILGFSAGGVLAIQLSLSDKIEHRPNFAGFIYSQFNPKLFPPLAPTTPPAFIACAADDLLAPSINSINLYDAWQEMKRPAELHIYYKGGHGLRTTTIATTWINRFVDWMEMNSFSTSNK